MSQHNPAALFEGGIFHGRYRIVRCIKAGGMGAVYECVHLTTQKHRALKVMLPQILATAGMRERFELEARVTAVIESEHIVETFDAGIDEPTGAPFLVMELLRGDDLDNLVQTQGPFNAEETVALLSQAALALDRTHAAGIVHRDLKPQNMFLTTRDDGSPRLKILDFGIAKVVADGSRTAQQTAAIGTPVFMSPEQTTGDGAIGPAADLYALAHIAYALLVGQPYWMEEQQALPMYAFLSRMLAGPAEPPSERAARRGVTLPEAFDAWFARATARMPQYRFERASAQIAELATVLGTPAPRQLLLAPSPITQRALPPPAGSMPSGPQAVPALSAPGGTPPPASMPSRPGTTAGTMGDLANTPAPVRPAASRGAVVGLALGGIAVVALGAFGVMRGLGGSPGTAAAPVVSVVAPLPQAPFAPSAASTPVPAVIPSEAPSAAAPVVVPDRGAASAHPAAASVKDAARKPTAPAVAAPATATAAPAPAKNCTPPYTIDASGHRQYKPECL